MLTSLVVSVTTLPKTVLIVVVIVLYYFDHNHVGFVKSPPRYAILSIFLVLASLANTDGSSQRLANLSNPE